MRTRSLGCLCLVLLGLALPGQAQEDESTAQRYAQLRVEFVGELTALLGWCGGAQLWLEQARLAGVVFGFDPESPMALAALRIREPENEGEQGAMQELAQREAALHERWDEELSFLLARHPDGLNASARLVELERLLRFVPDHAGARASAGEVRDGEQWILRETQRSRRRALELGERGEATPLVRLVQLNANEMQPSEMLTSYAFASYLLEGWPERCRQIVLRTGWGRGAPELLAEALDYPFPFIERRFQRWLSER